MNRIAKTLSKSSNINTQKLLLKYLSKQELIEWMLFGNNIHREVLEKLVELCETEKTFYLLDGNFLYAFHKSKTWLKFFLPYTRKDFIRYIEPAHTV